uniref:Uncharacterized protein n=1 Tax=Nelumbo nucifera TaxID=4432 RepID=A0A822Z192_NELNU|nr:TPA_asm: hypothetical protein HUJ06_007910 [Nelumbo nucifera]
MESNVNSFIPPLGNGYHMPCIVCASIFEVLFNIGVFNSFMDRLVAKKG